MNWKKCKFILYKIERVSQDYVYVKGEYKGTLQKIYHYLRCETKVDKIKALSYYDALR